MPRFLVPRKSSEHRVAAIALYRALLSRCTSAPLADEQRTALHNAIRNRFRQNRQRQSVHQLRLIFRSGYEVLNQLDAASTGDSASTAFLMSFISSLPKSLKNPARPQPPPKKLKTEHTPILPSERAMLNVRPYNTTTGPRHVPILASANGVPFLRLTKPQPANLSRVLRQRLALKIKNFEDQVIFANYWMPIAVWEDQWDENVRMRAETEQREGSTKEGVVSAEAQSQRGQEKREPEWVDELERSMEVAREFKEKDSRKDRVLRERMMEIIEKEIALAVAEGQVVYPQGSRAKPKKPRKRAK